MVPTPLSIGLTLCHSVIIEEGTRNLTHVGTFSGFRAADFPFEPAPFYVVASLVGGHGEGELELAVTQLETDDELFALHRRLSFPDRLMEVKVVFRLGNCEFPEPGAYLMTLLMDGGVGGATAISGFLQGVFRMSEPKQPQPNKPVGQTESWNSVIVVIDEPGDTTRRPRRPNIPLDPPPRVGLNPTPGTRRQVRPDRDRPTSGNFLEPRSAPGRSGDRITVSSA